MRIAATLTTIQNPTSTPIVNIQSQTCLMPLGTSSSLGTPLTIAACDSSPDQNWQIVPLPLGTYLVINQQTSLCLNDQWGSQRAGTNVFLWECDDWDTNNLWNLTFNGYWEFKSLRSGLVLEVSVGAISDGSQIEQSYPNGPNGGPGQNQLWSFPSPGMPHSL